MIKKRQPENKNKQTASNQPKKPIGTKQLTKHPEFKTYREEACYVLNLLEKQGINIYEEGRYGGMYLNNRSGGRISHIFSDTNNSKKENNIQQINNNEISDNDLSKLFANKKK